jgi:hypothetical protein
MIALVTGGAVIGGDVFLSGCTSGAKADSGFTQATIALLDEVGETILPATSTPGAKAAQVGQFMKTYVTDCYNQARRDAFMNGITAIDAASHSLNGKAFVEASPEQRKQLLQNLEKEAKDYNEAQAKKDRPGFEELQKQNLGYQFISSPLHYYTMMKQLTLLGYFTSEVGATKALRHNAVPGHYDGAFPYKKGDKAWAEQ